MAIHPDAHKGSPLHGEMNKVGDLGCITCPRIFRGDIDVPHKFEFLALLTREFAHVEAFRGSL
ncbi:hypothetical protein OS31_09010 [Dickeya oryzae]